MGLTGAAEASAWSPSEGELLSPWRPAEEPADAGVVPSGTGRNQWWCSAGLTSEAGGHPAPGAHLEKMKMMKMMTVLVAAGEGEQLVTGLGCSQHKLCDGGKLLMTWCGPAAPDACWESEEPEVKGQRRFWRPQLWKERFLSLPELCCSITPNQPLRTGTRVELTDYTSPETPETGRGAFRDRPTIPSGSSSKAIVQLLNQAGTSADLNPSSSSPRLLHHFR